MNLTPHALAIAFARVVLPVPGAPTSRAPRSTCDHAQLAGDRRVDVGDEVLGELARFAEAVQLVERAGPVPGRPTPRRSATCDRTNSKASRRRQLHPARMLEVGVQQVLDPLGAPAASRAGGALADDALEQALEQVRVDRRKPKDEIRVAAQALRQVREPFAADDRGEVVRRRCRRRAARPAWPAGRPAAGSGRSPGPNSAARTRRGPPGRCRQSRRRRAHRAAALPRQGGR